MILGRPRIATAIGHAAFHSIEKSQAYLQGACDFVAAPRWSHSVPTVLIGQEPRRLHAAGRLTLG